MVVMWVLVIIAAAALPYIASLRGDFALDDVQLIVKDPYVHSLKYVLKAFTRDFLHGALGPNVIYYRPLVTVSFQLNYAISGPNPFAYRLTNLLFHIVTSLLVFALSQRILGNLRTAGLAALVFAVLPAHAEAVGWVSGRTDVISALLTVSAVLVFVKACESEHKSSAKAIVACSLLALCAFFSKENALVLPLVMAGYVWVFRCHLTKADRTKWAVAIVLSLLIFTLFRRHAVHVTIVNYPTAALGKRLLGIGIAYAAYIRMMFIPQLGRVVYDVFPIGIKYPPVALAAWLIPIGLAMSAVRLRQNVPHLAFALLWILVTLLPVVNLLPAMSPIPAERFVYLPSVGSSMIIGWLANRILTWKPRQLRIWRIIGWAIIVWFVLYCGALTVESCQPYSSDVAWARAISKTGGRFFRSWAGYYFFKAGLYREAEHEYKAAIEHGSRDVTDYLGLANSLRALGRPNHAQKVLLEALEEIGDDARIYVSLGSSYILLGDLKKAEQAFSRAILLNPKLRAAWIGLARVSLRLGDFNKAIDSYAKANALGILSTNDRFEYALACEKAGLVKRALEQYEQTAQEDPKGELGSEAAKRATRLRNLTLK